MSSETCIARFVELEVVLATAEEAADDGEALVNIAAVVVCIEDLVCTGGLLDELASAAELAPTNVVIAELDTGAAVTCTFVNGTAKLKCQWHDLPHNVSIKQCWSVRLVCWST